MLGKVIQMHQNLFKICFVAWLFVGILLGVGCKEPEGSASSQKIEVEDNADNEKREPTSTGIFGRSTNEIGEFDNSGNAQVSDGQMRPTNPLNPLGSLNSYGPIVEKLAKQHIDRCLNLFRATHDRYPNSHQEFMEQVIQANKVELPVLPGGKKYQYDVENHELVVVESEKK